MILQELGLSTRVGDIEKLYRDTFTSRDTSTYKYTSVIARHLMGGKDVAGLLYPSIANQSMSHNLVLKKDFVDVGLLPHLP